MTADKPAHRTLSAAGSRSASTWRSSALRSSCCARSSRSTSSAEIVGSLHHIGWPYIWASLALTILGYGALVGIRLPVAADGAAIRSPSARMWPASFVSQAVQNSAPMAIVAGGGMRYRLFSRLGITGAETAAVVAGNLLTFVHRALRRRRHQLRDRTGVDPAHRFISLSSRCSPSASSSCCSSLQRSSCRERRHRHASALALEARPAARARRCASRLGVSVADWLLSSTALYVLMLRRAARSPFRVPERLPARADRDPGGAAARRHWRFRGGDAAAAAAQEYRHRSPPRHCWSIAWSTTCCRSSSPPRSWRLKRRGSTNATPRRPCGWRAKSRRTSSPC